LNRRQRGVAMPDERFIKKRREIIECHRDSSYWNAYCALFTRMSMLRRTINQIVWEST
jgi:hypothetical protein